MRSRHGFLALALALAGVRCAAPAARPGSADDARTLALADAYVAAWFEREPLEATEVSWPGAADGRLPDRSPEAIAAWERREDGWLAELSALAPPAPGTPAALARAIVLERLEAARGLRACRFHLWSVSPIRGWQARLGDMAALQPVGTPRARAAAVARLEALPAFLAADLENLRRGIRTGWVAPRASVERVIADLDALLAEPAATSALALPGVRDPDPAFRAALASALENAALPAIRAYRDALAAEVLPSARASAGVADTPGGEGCYRAALRSYATVDVAPAELHALGARHLAEVERQMRELAARSFGGEEIRALLRRLATDPRHTFASREDILERTRAAERRARERLARWFGRVPRAEVVVRPVAPFQERSALVSYVVAAADGSRPGTIFVNPSEPARQSRATLEAVAFHEGLPGHHLQLGLAVEDARLPAAARFLAFDGFVEGWALYAERLADEMGLYSTDVERLGMLSWEALRAARLVVDSGLHVLGWSEEQAVEFLLTHTSVSRRQAAAQVARYVATPGQAPSYLLGMLELRRLRDEAERALGDRFDLRAFHDRLLEHGSVPLAFARSDVERWIIARR
ncbi:MAG TPA: DUF885 domain-containing protein [Anaeromyxobacteraceae bacterium]|nr:DUF885 domain-containing protein [Anaeromyxobacteraceae bacterium]